MTSCARWGKLAHANKQRFLKAVKIENCNGKNDIFFYIFAQNMHRGYTLEPSRRVPRIYVLDKK